MITVVPSKAIRWQKAAVVPLVMTMLFAAIALLPRVRSNQRLIWAFSGISAFLLFWQAVVLIRATRAGHRLIFELLPIKSHYVQATVQLSVIVYWGCYWRRVYDEAPLIIGQVLFLYVLGALLSWSRGRTWQLGFGPLPIIFGTSLFMWFKDDWFIFQFLMIAAGALGKEFIRWNRDGQSTHIFNPSAGGLTLVSFILLLTGTTHYTWGEEIATTLGAPPYIYLQVFLVGLVVQYFFAVTLMTFSAVAMLCLLNLIYTGTTGVYHFIDSNIPIAVFLGLHLLITDPATSPKTNAGKVIFGGFYGTGVFVVYAILAHFGAPRFYDKLLIVPFLNLCVPAIDRFARTGVLGRFTNWESTVGVRKLNLIHMGCWALLFSVMLGAGFVQAPHEGSSIAFWEKACEQGRPRARENLIQILQTLSDGGSGEACNELGLLYIEGKLLDRNPDAAAFCFAKGSELGHLGACANMAIQYLFYGVAKSQEELGHALAQLEKECGQPTNTNGLNCYLVGFAYETGRGRPIDKKRAREFYTMGSRLRDGGASKSLAKMQLSGEGGPVDRAGAAQALEMACKTGDAQSCLYLGLMYRKGDGVPLDEARAHALLQRACDMGVSEACAILRSPNK